MYTLKGRNLGTIRIDDDKLGAEILRQWQLGNIPKVITIGEETFLSRLIENIKKDKEEELTLQQLPDDKLKILANQFIKKMKYAKSIPEQDYSNNEIYPYNTNFLLHIFAVHNVISNNNPDKIWRITVNYTINGKECISSFNELDTQYKALLELRDRYWGKYEKYTNLFYDKEKNIKALDDWHSRHNKFKSTKLIQL